MDMITRITMVGDDLPMEIVCLSWKGRVSSLLHSYVVLVDKIEDAFTKASGLNIYFQSIK